MKTEESIVESFEKLHRSPGSDDCIRNVVIDLEGDNVLLRLGNDFLKDHELMFYKEYLIALFEEYIYDGEVREILLMAFCLLEGYNEDLQADRFDKYVKDSYGSNTKIRKKVYSDSCTSLRRGVIFPNIKILVHRLFAKLERNNGQLGVAEVVAEEFVKKYTDETIDTFSLAKPQYTSSTKENETVAEDLVSQEQNDISDEAVADDNDSSSDEPSVPSSENSQEEVPAVEEIFPTEFDIELIPGGEPCKLAVSVLPVEAQNVPLSFFSRNPDIVTVSPTGMLLAHKKPQEFIHKSGRTSFLKPPKKKLSGKQSVEIVIQAESGVTKSKFVTVNFSAERNAPSTSIGNINDFVPDFTVEQLVRVVGGEKVWSHYVYANVGDIVEFRMVYQNISKSNQLHVAVRGILPRSLKYVDDSTKLINAKYPQGTHLYTKPEQNDCSDGTDLLYDGSIFNGVNIGSYGPNGNAYIYLRAEVVEFNLPAKSSMLVNWIQCQANQVILQDYASVIVKR